MPAELQTRPGREAPEDAAVGATLGSVTSFNEAGARSPGRLAPLPPPGVAFVASTRPGREAPEQSSPCRPMRRPALPEPAEVPGVLAPVGPEQPVLELFDLLSANTSICFL